MQPHARRLLSKLSQWANEDRRTRYFETTPMRIDGLWRQHRDSLAVALPAVADLHIHDMRAEALARLARKVDVFTLSRISGIKDLQMLNERYYRERADQIAARL